MKFKNVVIDGLNIFYREDGDPSAPNLVLLGGFPASSHQFRNLMPALAKRFHVVAPDYPAFGSSAMPDPESFAYTFDRTSEIVESLLRTLGISRFGLYMHDYGAPVGFRIVTRRPDWLQWLIVQNANAYEVGFTPVWDPIRKYWNQRNAETERPLMAFFQPENIKQVYLHGHKDPEAISPDNWNMDSYFLARPNAPRAHLDLLYDYRKNLSLYPAWQAFLRRESPKTIIFWGQNDIFFAKEGGEAYLADLPKAELHRLDSGHFAVEDCLPYITDKMLAFFQRAVA